MPPTAREIAERLRYRPEYTRTLLARLVAAGVLRRVAGGWTVVEP